MIARRNKEMQNAILTFLLTLILWPFFATGVSAQTTAFTYQGSLKDGATPANGNYDITFKLFSTVSGGSQIGGTATADDQPVANGIFTVILDFGSAPFTTNADVFLEIAFRPGASTGAYTTLTPRTYFAASPYAVQAVNSGQLGGVAASQYVLTTDPRMTDARSPTAGSANYIQNQNAAPQASSNFNISGTGTANILSAATQYNIGADRILTTTGNANLIVGRNAGTSNFGQFNSFFGASAGSSNTAGDFNSFFGTTSGAANTSGNRNSFFGERTGTANATGSANSFFGSQAGEDTTGNSNSFFGASSGLQNSTGSVNAFFGTSAGTSNTTGQENAFFGANAGTGVTTGDRNTAVGYFVRIGTGDLTNATAIGARSQVDADNSLILGSVNGVNLAVSDTNVGIGTTAPAKHLHIRGAGDQEIMLESSDAGGVKWTLQSSSGASNGRFEIINRTASLSKVTILASGDVGIGDTTPSDKLDVNGDVRVGTSGSNGCLINNNGGAIIGTCSSDARFKRHITPVESVLKQITALQPRHFYWRISDFPSKGFGAERETGLIAQEVEQVLPELVTTDENGFKAINYSRLPLLTIQAIKEQQDLIEAQQKENAELKKEVDALKAVVCSIKADAEVCKTR